MAELTSEQQRFKDLDTDNDGHLGSKERADAIIEKVGKKECRPAHDYIETYKFAYGEKAEPTKQELAKFLDGMAKPDTASTGAALSVGMTEVQLASSDGLKNIFPKGVEHTTPEDFSRTSEVIAAKITGCAKSAAAELRR